MHCFFRSKMDGWAREMRYPKPEEGGKEQGESGCKVLG